MSDAKRAPDEPAAPGVDRIRVGVGGWTYAPWRAGMFYPAGLAQRRELEYASRHLTAIEINGTYYRAQKPAIYAKWRDETPEGFVFSAKAPRRIVESRTLANTGPQIDDFINGIVELGDRLGPLVWQFTARHKLDAEDFAKFLDLLPKKANGRRLRHALDVRDPAFVDSAYRDLVRSHGMATVFTDSDEEPSFADITGDFVYARLMRSHADSITGYERGAIKDWARRASLWASGGEPDDLPRIGPPSAKPDPKQRDVFVFFIGGAKERNPCAAMTLIDELSSHSA
ncbi:DUF72 domain-containing protein [Lysobacter ciconiae]|uniref:DUF72 domain-containing protein n=1 Tax=Novilysobacter ciconiae TaxID=2781022 RepID=A0A7S6UIA6_9GAMM|nr:DUF72 domain-containing protein [Lysobacter ciconiae]QOW20843.1 DUF72 domain-containing protein [Lysobacter ciconiae]